MIDTKILRKEDFIIQLTPIVKPNTFEWSGSVVINIATSGKNPMNKKDISDLWHLCRMMCSVIPLTEENPEFNDLLDTFLRKTDKDFGNQDNKKDKKRLTNIERDGNIIRLNFKTGENA